MFKYTPAVFAVGKNYQIMVPVTGHSLFRVKVGDKYFYDEQNGIMCSLSSVHRVTVPAWILDREKKYTVCEREIIERLPYFPTTEEEVESEFDFSPIPEKNIRIYHVADTHNLSEEPCRAAELFGNTDLLIMNGDIPDHSGDVSNFDTIYDIAERLTKGRIPIIFARGNHDMRGFHAEDIYTEWSRLIKENISPNLMICGHLHELAIGEVGGRFDHLGQPCTLVVGSDRKNKPLMHAGCGIVLNGKENVKVEFCDSNGEHTYHTIAKI